MIVLKNQGRSNLRWLQLCIMLGALIMLHVGLTIAQDSENNKPQKLEPDRIEQQETKATVHQVQEERKVEEISGQEDKNRSTAYEQILSFQIIKEQANEISRKAAELEALSKTYTMNHPKMISLKEEMDQQLLQIQKISNLLNAKEKR